MRIALFLALATAACGFAADQHLLYVANPGTRNYVEYGGVGISVFDASNGYKFVRRIPTWEVAAGKEPENVKGIAASAKTGIVYVTSLSHMIAIDAISGKKIWDKSYEGGCDRMAISPDGKILYVPQFEGPSWHVVNGATGDVLATITPDSGSHNTIYSADGKRIPGGTEVAGAVDRGSEDAHGCEHGRAVRQRDPAVHGEWRQYAGFRQRQRAARLRSRGHQDRQEAVPGRSGRL
jgi:DNA-binding beta-propeller fold protein YncE